MSGELRGLHLSAMGSLRPSDLGGEACEDCPHNQHGDSCALIYGDGEALRACAKLLFKECELVPLGTKARIAELEAERDRLREALREIKHVPRGKDGGIYDSDGDWHENECSSCLRMQLIAETTLIGAGE